MAVSVRVDQHRIIGLIGGEWKTRKRVRHELGDVTCRARTPVHGIRESDFLFNVGTRTRSGSVLGWIPERDHERTVRGDIVPISPRWIGQQSRNSPHWVWTREFGKRRD